MNDNFSIKILYKIIQNRLINKPNNSYVAKLTTDGIDRAVQKIGEEAIETVIAAKNFAVDKFKKELFIGEVSDLLFHSLVVLALLDIDPEEILACLEKRCNNKK